MPRPLRIEYGGARYHVMGRGNRGAPVFGTDADCRLFLETLGEAVERTGWVVHAWVLMKTHYHLLLETPEPNLVAGMNWFPGTFTQRYNILHKEWGHLFQGRYKAKIIDDKDPAYFRKVADYIHLNPAVAGLLNKKKPDLAKYGWSSFPHYLEAPSKRPPILRTAEVLACHGIDRDNPAGRDVYAALMQERVYDVIRERDGKVFGHEWQQYDRGWAHGSESFHQKMSNYLEKERPYNRVPSYDKEQHRSRTQAAAEARVREALRVVGLGNTTLEDLKKGDHRKLLVGGWLHTHYPVTRKWIAERLSLGHPSRVAAAIAAYRSLAKEEKWKMELEKIIRLSG